MEAAAHRRAVYVHKATKAREACAPWSALALVLYPTVLGFLLAARVGVFSLLIPTPTIPGTPPSPPGQLHGNFDLWDANNRGSVVRTAGAYMVIIAVHLFAAAPLIMRGIPGSWYIMPVYAWIAPMFLWVSTTVFCFNYATLTRYGALAGEWAAAIAVSMLIFFTTILLLCWGVRISDVLRPEEDPEAPLPAAAAAANQNE
ncbi:unnamed protein product [Urochloa humidicola]